MADNKDLFNKKNNTENIQKKSDIAKREEAIIEFWNSSNIFKKTEAKDSPKGEYIFYDGPPFATGLPHYGSLLSSISKDVIPRYKTMRGFHVRRRWGWDCHGLPIENMIEKELGLKSKKDILEIGIEKFNEACRESVLRYAHNWKDYIERIGRWVEFENAYRTMDNSYIESVWWFLKNMHQKNLLYEGRKVLLYCPHCETPLAKAEIAMDNSYKDVTEESVYVKFKIKNPKNYNLPEDTSILAWTTTPWTLPSNIVLAVGEGIDYILVKTKEHGHIILAKNKRDVIEESGDIIKDLKGKELIDISYEPLYDIQKVLESKKENTYTILPADFVTTEEGTGIVHTAVIYGEDDYQLGLEKDLPMVPLLDQSGHFNNDAPTIIAGEYFKKAQKTIIEDLKRRNLLFKTEMHTHSYPHCHRCDTALIYSALTSWFLNIQKVKDRLLKTNKDINWIPGHLKNGRYRHILETAPDWTISRNRFWASPLPIWKHSKTGKVTVFGSIEELKAHTKKSGNTYYMMRHGEADHNIEKVISSKKDNPHHLTENGKQHVLDTTKDLKEIDLIFTSPFIRTKETAEIARKQLGLSDNQVIVEDNITESDAGTFNGKTVDEWHEYFGSPEEEFKKRPPEGENLVDVRKRMGEFIYRLENEYSGKRILIISHGDPLWMLNMLVRGDSLEESIKKQNPTYPKSDHVEYPKTGVVVKLDFTPLPHNKNYELDLHRPYIDEVEVIGSDGERLERIPEVIDGWVESGAMPFAEYHYPFENTDVFNPKKGLFKKQKRYPADFVSEYIAQTRTWFYYMHAVSVLQFDSVSYKNVLTTGNILTEDGSKMSKSKKNYTDPFLNLNKFGADALRYYLMSSVVMQAEDTKFVDDELKEAHNRVVNILWNTFKFYDLYKEDYDSAVSPQDSSNVLDVWILSRLNQTNKEITKNFEKYNTVHAARAMRDFIEDFSTWYLRRSRNRFKSENTEDKKDALSVTRHVLVEFSKLIAPIMPFIAESIYRSVGGEKESVHLCDWPKEGVVNEEIINDIKQVRNIVSHALEARAVEGIKVRQPLQSLTVKKSQLEKESQYVELIKNEVNVKEVKFEGEDDVALLDTELSNELKREGLSRDIIRQIQQFRKNSNLTPQDTITLIIDAEDEFKKIIEESIEEIKQTALIKEIIFDSISDEGIFVEGKRMAFAIKETN